MKFEENIDSFEEAQATLARAIHSAVREDLSQTELSKPEIDDAALSILFQVGSILDGISSTTGEWTPFVTFINERKENVAYFSDEAAGIHEISESVVATEEKEIAESLDDIEESKTFQVVIRFESGIAILHREVGWEDANEVKQEFAREFHKILDPTKNRTKEKVVVSSLSPLFSKINSVRITQAEGEYEIEDRRLEELTIVQLYKRILKAVETKGPNQTLLDNA